MPDGNHSLHNSNRAQKNGGACLPNQAKVQGIHPIDQDATKQHLLFFLKLRLDNGNNRANHAADLSQKIHSFSPL